MTIDRPAKQTKLVAFRVEPEMAEFIERLAQENFRTQSQELRRLITLEKQRAEREEDSVEQ